MYRHNLKIVSVGADGPAVAISFANVSGCQEGPMAAFRIFGFSLLLTVAALALGYAHGGLNALFLLVVLAVLEVSLSFDNAIINAAVLKRMSPFWRQMFLTVGILIAVFGMRLVFPLLIVWATAGIDPVRAMELALNPPPHGALEYPDGSPSYEKLIISAHPQIAAFGGTFLLMLFLDFVLDDRDIKWLKWIEVPFARIGRLGQMSVVVTGKAGLMLFLYLEVLDAAFSFDGVTGAFAITSDPIVIALGLGLVGSMFVRSITVYLVHQEALDRYVYLEHGAQWAIGVLAAIMLLSIDERFQIPEVVTASVGVVFIGAALSWSVLRNRRAAKAAAWAARPRSARRCAVR
jgi:hypothetical protein